MKAARLPLLVGLLLAGASAPAAVGSATLHGHVKTQLSYHLFRRDDVAAVAGREVEDALLDARLNLEAHQGRWNLVAHLQVAGAAGDSPGLLQDPAVASLGAAALGLPFSDDRSSWLDLDHTVTATGSRILFARLDRMSVGYTGDRLVLRLGRQALSWGNGLVFQVFDLFDPFAPNASDTEYKPGTDMLWGQWLFPSGDDLQALVVPRRDPRTGALTRDESSLAAKWHHLGDAVELDLLLARHFDDSVLGVGASRDLAGGVARVDLTLTRLAGGREVLSALLNLDHSWVLRGKNVYGFAELHRNGFGSRRLSEGVAGLDAALVERLERGEVFTVGRDELAVGAEVQVTPLTSLAPTLLANARDGSSLALLRLRRELGDELRLDVGLQVPWGGRGSEYGGLPVAPGAAELRYVSPGSWLWVRLSRYF